tara:strand:- start:1095 stop:1295 length:201 start_codon:yes stop_codon:yes gene_type:complete
MLQLQAATPIETISSGLSRKRLTVNKQSSPEDIDLQSLSCAFKALTIELSQTVRVGDQLTEELATD